MAGSSRQGTTVRAPSHLTEQVHERMDRVRDEARALARFRHPSIVTVHEFFEENDSIYVVMELVEGRSLRQIITEAGGPLPEAQVLGYARAIGEALGAVHSQNLLHRDVKPDNVIITGDGDVVLIDFGTAREFSSDQSSQMSQTLSPGYAPVEQYTARGRFGPSTDIYALGATMYHMATGRFPTPSLDRFTGQALPPPHEVNPAISRQLSQAIMWAMNVESADRPQTAKSLLDALGGGAEVPQAPDPGATRMVAPAAPAPGTQAVPTSPTVPSPTSPVTPAAGTGKAPPSARPPVARPRRTPKKRRRFRRGARRLGRTVVNLVITIAIAIGATFAVAWYFNQQSGDETVPQPMHISVTAPASTHT